MRSSAGWLATAGAVLLAATASAPAVATSIEEEGLWYFDWFRVQDAHDQGVTGEGVTIAMIDGQVNLDLPTLADADIRVQDPVCVLADGSGFSGTSTDYEQAHHGTSVLSLLVGSGEGFAGQTGVKGLAPGATVLTYYVRGFDEDVSDPECPGTTLPSGDTLMSGPDEMAASMHAAVDGGADIISVSLGGPSSVALAEAVARAVREDVIVVSGVPNEGDFQSGSAPGGLNGVVTVQLSGPDGEVPFDSGTDVVAPGRSLLLQGVPGDGAKPDWERQRLGTGTSYATPIVAGNLALAMQKYPDATPNQLIQSLIHNTGTEPHELQYEEGPGYGMVITDVFLAADPSAYPDVNPLVSNFRDAHPPVSWIWEGAVDSEASEYDEPRPWPMYTPEPKHNDADAAPDDQSPSPDTDPDSTPTSTQGAVEEPGESALGWLIPAIVVGVAVLIVLAIVIAIAVTRSSRSGGEDR